MVDKLRIVVVEDDAVIGMKITHDLEELGHQVISTEYNSQSALEVIHSQRPDLILLDINIDGTMDGIDVAMIIREKYNIPFIFLTALSDQNTLQRAKVANPCAYLVKPYKTIDLHTSITIGLFNFEDKSDHKNLTITDVNVIALSPLSDREFEILLDISRGLSNAQIAEKQFVSLSTIKWHLQNIYSKLDVKNRISAVKKVMR